jgi:putative flippase GtrA
VIGRQFALFSVAGIVGFAVDVAVLYCAVALGGGLYLGRVASFLAAAFTTWQFNRYFTFPRGTPPPVWKEWGRYLSAMTFGAIVNYIAYAVTLRVLSTAWWVPMLGVAVGSVCGLFVNFLLARQWVFKSG